MRLNIISWLPLFSKDLEKIEIMDRTITSMKAEYLISVQGATGTIVKQLNGNVEDDGFMKLTFEGVFPFTIDWLPYGAWDTIRIFYEIDPSNGAILSYTESEDGWLNYEAVYNPDKINTVKAILDSYSDYRYTYEYNEQLDITEQHHYVFDIITTFNYTYDSKNNWTVCDYSSKYENGSYRRNIVYFD